MTADELSLRLVEKVEFMLMQYLPRPTCPNKQQAHADLIKEVKAKIAAKLVPGSGGIMIEIKV